VLPAASRLNSSEASVLPFRTPCRNSVENSVARDRNRSPTPLTTAARKTGKASPTPLESTESRIRIHNGLDGQNEKNATMAPFVFPACPLPGPSAQSSTSQAHRRQPASVFHRGRDIKLEKLDSRLAVPHGPRGVFGGLIQLFPLHDLLMLGGRRGRTRHLINAAMYLAEVWQIRVDFSCGSFSTFKQAPLQS